MRKETLRRIEEAVASCEGIVTIAEAARAGGIPTPTVWSAVHEAPQLRMQMARRTVANIRAMDDVEVLSLLARRSPGAGVTRVPEAGRELHRRLDRLIRETIQSARDLPSAKSLMRSLNGRFDVRLAHQAIQARLRKRPELEKALSSRGLSLLESWDDAELLRRYSGWALQYHAAEVRTAAVRRIDRAIMDAIRDDPGIATARSVTRTLRARGRGIRIDSTTIRAHLRRNPKLREALREQGRRRVQMMSARAVVATMAGRGKTTAVPPQLRKLLRARVAEILQREIDGSKRIPTVHCLARKLGFRTTTVVSSILARDASLRSYMIEKGRQVVANMKDRALVRTYGQRANLDLPRAVRAAMERRVRGLLRRVIDEYEGVPTPAGVGAVAGMTEKTVKVLLRRDKDLTAAMRARGDAWLRQVAPADAVPWLMEGGPWAAEARDLVLARVDEVLLKAINEQTDPTLESLADATGVAPSYVGIRLRQSTELLRSFWRARGLSDDQIIERLLGKAITPALAGLMEERLRNLHVYREMRALLRLLGEELSGDVLEISLYPAPLAAAVADVDHGSDCTVAYQPMEDFRRQRVGRLPRVDVVVLQGIHRLTTKPMTTAVLASRAALRRGGSLVATHRTDHVATKRFLDAVEAHGLRLRVEGRLSFDLPDRKALLELGLSAVAAGRVMQKATGEAHVLVFDAVPRRGDPGSIPKLHRRRETAEPRRAAGRAKTISMPTGLASALGYRFRGAPEASRGDPFLVNVTNRGKVIAILAYGLNPGRRKVLEFAVYPAAPSHEAWAGHAERLVEDREAAERLGLGERREISVPLRRLRRALG